jgi:hypothetical protein
MQLAQWKVAQCFIAALVVVLTSAQDVSAQISGEELNQLNDALSTLEKEVPNAEKNMPSAAVKKAEDELDAKAMKNLKTPKDKKEEKEKAQKEEDEAKKAADEAKAKENPGGQKKADAYRDALDKIRKARIVVETLSPKIKLAGGTFVTDDLRKAKGRSSAFLNRIKKLLETRPTALRTVERPSPTGLARSETSARPKRTARTGAGNGAWHCPGSVFGADPAKRDPDPAVTLAMMKECDNWNGFGGR